MQPCAAGRSLTWWSTAAGCKGAGAPSVATATGNCLLHSPPSFPPGCTRGRVGGCSFPAGAQASKEAADSAGDVDKRAEQGMSWPAEHGSMFYGPAEELKTVSPPWRPASLARMTSCSVPSGLIAGDTASLSPKNSASLGAEYHPPSAHVREDKAGQRLGRAWEHRNIVCWEAVWIRNSQRISGLDKMPGRRISLLNSSNWTHLQESGKQSELLTLSTGKEKEPAEESQLSSRSSKSGCQLGTDCEGWWVTWEEPALMLGA